MPLRATAFCSIPSSTRMYIRRALPRDPHDAFSFVGGGRDVSAPDGTPRAAGRSTPTPKKERRRTSNLNPNVAAIAAAALRAR
ncbi:hypothetical protein MRX96_031979 [Rhipicephalus microplus]